MEVMKNKVLLIFLLAIIFASLGANVTQAIGFSSFGGKITAILPYTGCGMPVISVQSGLVPLILGILPSTSIYANKITLPGAYALGLYIPIPTPCFTPPSPIPTGYAFPVMSIGTSLLP